MNWSIIKHIIYMDYLTMNGGKNNMRSLAVLMLLFFCGMGFLVSPIAGIYCPFLIGVFFVPMLFQNEVKYHSEKLTCLLPIRRRDLVTARFLMTMVSYLVCCGIVYLLMLLAMQVKLYLWWAPADEGEPTDITSMLAETLGFTELGLFNLIYSIALGFTLFAVAQTLRKYFRDPTFVNAVNSMTIKKSTRTEIIAMIVILGLLLLWVLAVTGILPIGPAAAIVVQLVMQLARAANGFLMGSVALVIGLLEVICQYIATVFDYEKQEL
ncbi:MAG: ABC-2 transporter permease [Oscillospiraceae bacterium]|nr:ABC-2 transporter permease [Oscillospiraceae bacterium]